MKVKLNDEGRLNVRVPKDLLKRLKIEAVRRDKTIQAATIEALNGWLKTQRDLRQVEAIHEEDIRRARRKKEVAP